MILSAILSRAFDRADVRCFLDHTSERRVTPSIATDDAELVLREIEAQRTGTHLVRQRPERVRKAATLLRWLFEQMIREPERRLAPDAGQPGQLSGEIVDR